MVPEIEMKVKDEDEEDGGTQEDVAKRKKYCRNCGRDNHILQCTRTLLKKKKKRDTHVTCDDESAFFLHILVLTISHFVSSHEDVYFQRYEFNVYSNNKKDDPQHHFAFLSSMRDVCFDNVDQNYRDYSFLRFASCDSHDDTYIEYETLDFSIMSNMNDVSIDVFGMDHLQSENLVEPIALVA